MSQRVHPQNPNGLHPAGCTCCAAPSLSKAAFEEGLARSPSIASTLGRSAEAKKVGRFAQAHPLGCTCGCNDDDWSPIDTIISAPKAANGGRPADPKGRPIAGNASDVHNEGVLIHPAKKVEPNHRVLALQKPKKPKDTEFSAYNVRAAARDLHTRADARAVSLCGFGTLDGEAKIEQGVHKEGPRIGQKTAYYSGVKVCDSPWLCPVCGPRLGLARAAILAPQLKALEERGFSPWLITLTAQHGRDTALWDSISMFRDAWRYLKNGKAWNEKAKKVGGLEYVRGYDLTRTPWAGWHLHFHLVVMVGPGDQGQTQTDRGRTRTTANGEETAQWILDRWMTAIRAAGGTISKRGLDMRPAGNAAAAAAYATTLAGVAKRTGDDKVADRETVASGFSTVAEATAAASKRGRGLGGMTAADLRDEALKGTPKPPRFMSNMPRL